MAMTVKQLVQVLGDMEVCYYGPVNAEVYGVEYWNGKGDLEQGILYVAANEQMEGVSANVLMVNTAKVENVLKKLRIVLAKDYHISTMLMRLAEAVAKDSFIDVIAGICHEIMGHSVFFLDSEFTLIASSGSKEKKRFLTAILAQRKLDEGERMFVIPATHTCPCDSILNSIYYKGKIAGYVLVVAWEGKLGEGYERHYMEVMSTILSNYSQFGKFVVPISLKHQFLLELLQQRNNNVEKVEQRRKELGFPGYDKYYVLSIRIDEGKNTDLICRQIKACIKEEVYKYNHHYFAIVGCDILSRISEKNYPQLIQFLQSNDMYAGLSNGFLDYASLKTAFEQSIEIVAMRKRLLVTLFHFSRYEDMLLSHMIELGHQRGIAYEAFCHPNVVYIERYDQEHGTEYLKTLLAYIFNNTRLTETANKLFIHRNTLYHRINVLREQFGIDFDNPREFMKYQIACTTYGFTGGVEHADQFFGPMD